MHNGYSENSIEKMKKDLYRRNASKISNSKFRLRWDNFNNKKDWNDNTDNIMNKESKEKKFSMFEKIFAASFLFFIIAIAAASFLFFKGENIVSPDNIDISIFGPSAVDAGEELSLQIAVTNNNNAKIEFSDLLIEYPDGTRNIENKKKELPRERFSLGVVEPGETINSIVRAALFGEEGENKKIIITLEYRIEGSNAIFTKKTEYDVTISSSSVNLSINMLDEISANQEISMEVSIRSNSETLIEDLLLNVNYPFGFEITKSSPEPLYGNNIWLIGDIKSGEEKKILINGIIRGNDNENKIFRVEVGKQDDLQERKIGVVYSSVFRKVTIKKPFLGASLSLNGDYSNEYITEGNKSIRGDLKWVNNLASKIADAVIEIKFEGDALDKFSVIAENGEYNSSSNIIRWDKRTLEDLGLIEAGESGSVKFSFKAKSMLSSDAVELRNPEIKISLSISGARVSEDGAIEGIKEFVQKKVLINSNLQLIPRIVYYAGPFSNTGPLPPKAEQRTTYTVIFSAINSTNSMSNVRATAVLPSYVSFEGTIFPSGVDISYDNITGEVIWNIGSMNAGEGVTSSAREAAFQISFIPSVSHIGSIPDLLYDISISGRDDFTGKDIIYKKGNLNTNLSTDPQFKSEYSQVVR